MTKKMNENGARPNGRGGSPFEKGFIVAFRKTFIQELSSHIVYQFIVVVSDMMTAGSPGLLLPHNEWPMYVMAWMFFSFCGITITSIIAAALYDDDTRGLKRCRWCTRNRSLTRWFHYSIVIPIDMAVRFIAMPMFARSAGIMSPVIENLNNGLGFPYYFARCVFCVCLSFVISFMVCELPCGCFRRFAESIAPTGKPHEELVD